MPEAVEPPTWMTLPPPLFRRRNGGKAEVVGTAKTVALDVLDIAAVVRLEGSVDLGSSTQRWPSGACHVVDGSNRPGDGT